MLVGEELSSTHIPLEPVGWVLCQTHRGTHQGGQGWAPAGVGQPGTRVTATTSLLGGEERASAASLFFCLQGRAEEGLFS